MSSSDSEAFESADEDVTETKPVKKVEKKQPSSVDNESKKICVQSVKSEPEPPQPVPVVPLERNVDTAKIVERSDDEKNKNLVTDSDTEDLPSKVTQIEKKPSKQSLELETSCEFIEMDNSTKTSTTETKGEDDWGFETWDDDEMENEIDELVSKSKAMSTTDSISSTQPSNKDDKKSTSKDTNEEEQTEKLSDEDGWQIDDWDDEVPSNDQSNKDEKASKQEGFSNVLDKLSSNKPADSKNNWGWTPWGGMVQLISTATSHVSQVIESGIGVPDPEEIARLQHAENLKNRELGTVPDVREDDKSLTFGTLMSGVSQIGNRVLSGGLDTLEGIGKKTMTILQENDPGLRHARKMMDQDAPVLSQILREAKEKTEEAEQNLKEVQRQRYKKQLHFETLFDDYHGLVHLEALEMLSQQSSVKLRALMAPLTGLALSELEETLNEVKELCELPEMDNEDSDGLHATDELADKFKTSVEDLDVTVDFKDIIQCWADNISWLDGDSTKSAQELYEKALRCLAQTSAICINKMHKLAELLLIKDHHSTADEADSLVQITTVMCWHLSGIASRFGNVLSQMENKDEVNSLITSIFLEGSNSTSYVQNAFQLFIPILQMGAA